MKCNYAIKIYFQVQNKVDLTSIYIIFCAGTKWCGTGNAAEDLEDLGPLKELDTCCLDHDLCPDDLEPGQTRHNITNETPFTMLVLSLLRVSR